MIWRVVGISLLAIVFIGLSVAIAQTEQEPHHIFLPLISSDTSDTPFTTAPLPPPSLILMSTQPQTGTCNQAAPELDDGLQAWLVETDEQQIELALCTRLVLNTQPVSGTAMSGVARHGTAGTWFTTFEADDEGIAAIMFKRSQAGLDVAVDLSIDYGGARYTAQTSFPTTDDEASDGDTFNDEAPDDDAPKDNAPPISQESIVFTGTGQVVTDSFIPPALQSRVMVSHESEDLFSMKAYAVDGSTTHLLVSAIGVYSGSVLLDDGDRAYYLEVNANAPWSVTIEPLGTDQQLAEGLTGSGDVVSDQFDPTTTAPTPYLFSHSGDGFFSVWLHCAGASDLLQNEIDLVDNNEAIVQFKEGPCFWEVTANGDWMVLPKETSFRLHTMQENDRDTP